MADGLYWFFSLLLTTNAAAQRSSPLITWHDCTHDFNTTATIDCANISVPLNWKVPHGEQISVALNRRRCMDPSSRVGNLVYNPGGPGESAINAVGNDTGYFTERLMKHFDIIGMDPRGVGRSSPIQCDADLYNARMSLFPQTEEEYDGLVAVNVAFASSCLRLSGEIAKHVDSVSVAQDLEAVRIGLGGDQLNFFGFSYGTLLGTAYAELFPSNFRTLLLDAVLDHSLEDVPFLFEESVAREREFGRFAKWCDDDKECVLHGAGVAAVFDKVVARAYRTPIPAPGCESTCRSNVTGDEVLTNFNKYLHLRSTWPELAVAIKEAEGGNATLLSTVIATPTSGAWQGRVAACLELPHSNRDVYDFQHQQTLTSAIAPHTKGVTASHLFETTCAGWPIPQQNPPHLLKIDRTAQLAPAMLVNAMYDPQTSYGWAINVQRQMPGAVLLSRNGDGHGSYALHSEATHVMDTYLITGRLPQQNTIVHS